MSFCSFSKEFSENSYTLIENQYITKYMPQSDGFTVKVYLYGLFLCQHPSMELSVASMAKSFNCTEEEIKNAFSFWEDFDLVRILSKDPFVVEFLPVVNALGRPKKIRYDKYADFNKELQNKMQKVGRFVSYNESIKYMNFLQENNIEQEAFLLIAQYCIDKKGSNVTQSYIINKAKKFISQNLLTYQQVEKELSGYNIHEKDILSIFTSLNTFKAPEEGDYTLFDKWTTQYGLSLTAIKTAAKTLKRGSMENLDLLLNQVHEAGKISDDEVSAYLAENELLSNLTFKIARKLSIKIHSPQTYIEEYVEKWYNRGYDEEALCSIAVYCTRISHNTFIEMDSLIEELYRKSIISDENVNQYIADRNAELKILLEIKALCPSVRLGNSPLSMIKTWHDWNFNDAMILEAAKRSSSTVSPIPYMNKILSDWKQQNIFKVEDIPEASPTNLLIENRKEVDKRTKALDDKADRERYYADRRRSAQAKADKYIKKAETNPEYVRVSSELSSGNIELARAKVFEPNNVSVINERISRLRNRQREILSSMGMTEEMLIPQYQCKKCNDTGFLPDGKACECYNKR